MHIVCIDNLPFDTVMCQDLAFDLSLAALLGDNIYNFGELLAHPIVSWAFLGHDFFVPTAYLSFSHIICAS